MFLAKLKGLRRGPLTVSIVMIIVLAGALFMGIRYYPVGTREDTPQNQTQTPRQVVSTTSSAHILVAENKESANNPSGTKDKEVSLVPLKPHTTHKEAFKTAVFLGDSITEGLSYYDYLDDHQVIAGKGLSISKGIEAADKVIALNPKRVFILFGVNDVDDRMPSSWLVGNYQKLVQKLKTKLPKAELYVTSILPVSESLVKNPHINNSHINRCNGGLKEMARQENIKYVDLHGVVSAEGKGLFEADGIHFKRSFYSLWLNHLQSILV